MFWHLKHADGCFAFLFVDNETRLCSVLLGDSSTSVMKCIVPLAWGGELLEPDGFYLSCLTNMGWTLGTVLLGTSALHLWARQGIIYAPLLPSTPPSCRALLKKTHLGLHCQAEAQRCEILPFKAVLKFNICRSLFLKMPGKNSQYLRHLQSIWCESLYLSLPKRKSLILRVHMDFKQCYYQL